MNEAYPQRPRRLATSSEAMTELGLACVGMREALRETNDDGMRKFFESIVVRLERIVDNESHKVTQDLAQLLKVAGEDLYEFRVPAVDPELERPTPALKILRVERANLAESITTARKAAERIDGPVQSDGNDAIRIDRRVIAVELARLDERLRSVEDAVGDLRDEAEAADAAAEASASQVKLIDFHVRVFGVEALAAHFETRVGEDPSIPAQSNITHLSRSMTVMRKTARDLNLVVNGLKDWLTPGVRAAGGRVVRAAGRSWLTFRAVVRVVRRRFARGAEPIRDDGMVAAIFDADLPASQTEPPPDFDLKAVRAMILAGQAPPLAWRPFVKDLSFVGENRLKNLAPLAGLTALQRLDLSGTQVADLKPLAGLTDLKDLDLNGTQVADLKPLAGLTDLQTLDLNRTQVADLQTLAGLTKLRAIYVENRPRRLTLARTLGRTGIVQILR